MIQFRSFRYCHGFYNFRHMVIIVVLTGPNWSKTMPGHTAFDLYYKLNVLVYKPVLDDLESKSEAKFELSVKKQYKLME